MSTSPKQQNSMIGGLARHTIYEGLVALLVAVVHLILLRGVGPGLLLLFVAPPLAAFVVLQRSTAKGVRRLALAFLLLVALGAVVGPFQVILPRLGGVDQRLPAESDRLLTWYAVVYILFFLGIVPTWFFVGNLRRHWRGEPAMVSRFTCYLGLVPLALLWPTLPVLLGACWACGHLAVEFSPFLA